jgi:hypothetical protein
VDDDGENASNATLVMAALDELQDAEIEVAREMVRSGSDH